MRYFIKLFFAILMLCSFAGSLHAGVKEEDEVILIPGEEPFYGSTTGPLKVPSRGDIPIKIFYDENYSYLLFYAQTQIKIVEYGIYNQNGTQEKEGVLMNLGPGESQRECLHLSACGIYRIVILIGDKIYYGLIEI